MFQSCGFAPFTSAKTFEARFCAAGSSYTLLAFLPPCAPGIWNGECCSLAKESDRSASLTPTSTKATGATTTTTMGTSLRWAKLESTRQPSRRAYKSIGLTILMRLFVRCWQPLNRHGPSRRRANTLNALEGHRYSSIPARTSPSKSHSQKPVGQT